MNHVTTSFHAGHKMRWRQLWTKLAFVTGEVSKCVCHGEGWRRSVKRKTNWVPQCRQGLSLHHTPAVPAEWRGERSREGWGPAIIQREFNEAGVSLCHRG